MRLVLLRGTDVTLLREGESRRVACRRCSHRSHLNMRVMSRSGSARCLAGHLFSQRNMAVIARCCNGTAIPNLKRKQKDRMVELMLETARKVLPNDEELQARFADYIRWGAQIAVTASQPGSESSTLEPFRNGIGPQGATLNSRDGAHIPHAARFTSCNAASREGPGAGQAILLGEAGIGARRRETRRPATAVVVVTSRCSSPWEPRRAITPRWLGGRGHRNHGRGTESAWRGVRGVRPARSQDH